MSFKENPNGQSTPTKYDASQMRSYNSPAASSVGHGKKAPQPCQVMEVHELSTLMALEDGKALGVSGHVVGFRDGTTSDGTYYSFIYLGDNLMKSDPQQYTAAMPRMVVKINAWGDVAKKCAIVDEKMDIQVLHVQPGPVRNNSQEYKHELELRMTKDSEIKLLEEENACSIRTVTVEEILQGNVADTETVRVCGYVTAVGMIINKDDRDIMVQDGGFSIRCHLSGPYTKELSMFLNKRVSICPVKLTDYLQSLNGLSIQGGRRTLVELDKVVIKQELSLKPAKKVVEEEEDMEFLAQMKKADTTATEEKNAEKTELVVLGFNEDVLQMGGTGDFGSGDHQEGVDIGDDKDNKRTIDALPEVPVKEKSEGRKKKRTALMTVN